MPAAVVQDEGASFTEPKRKVRMICAFHQISEWICNGLQVDHEGDASEYQESEEGNCTTKWLIGYTKLVHIVAVFLIATGVGVYSFLAPESEEFAEFASGSSEVHSSQDSEMVSDELFSAADKDGSFEESTEASSSLDDVGVVKPKGTSCYLRM